MTVTIRPYETRDAAGANAVARAAFAQYEQHYDDWPTFIERICRLDALASEGELLVAEQGGAVVGAVLHVPPGRPRSAIFPLEWSVVLHTSPVMATALRMYESIGFVRDRDIPPIHGMAYGRYMLPATDVGQALAMLEAPRD